MPVSSLSTVPSYTSSDNQFLIVWNRQSISTRPASPLQTVAGATFSIATSDTEVAEANCYQKSLGKPIDLDAKKSRWQLKQSSLASARGKCGGTTRHLFLFGHSTWRTRANGHEERGLSVQNHFIAPQDMALLIDSLTTRCSGGFLAIWLLTCYGASNDLDTAADDSANDEHGVFGAQLAQSLSNPASMVFAFDRPVTIKTLDACRKAAKLFPDPKDLVENIETATLPNDQGVQVPLKQLLDQESQLLTFKK